MSHVHCCDEVAAAEPPQLRTFAEWVRDVDPTTTTWRRAKQWAELALAGEEPFGTVPQSERQHLFDEDQCWCNPEATD